MTVSVFHHRDESFWSLFHRIAEPGARRVGEPEIPDEIVSWLAGLMLLHGVPFEYLVPHPAMLPEESIRFFLLDRNWLLRLIEGAASVGVGSSRDAIVLLNQLEPLVEAAANRALAVRDRLRGRTAAAPEGTPLPWTGFLLRSAVVQGWPGLEIRAYDSAGATLRILRIDRLTPTVLLCIVQKIPARIELMEPGETLHFGVKELEPGTYSVALRGLGFGGFPAGQIIANSRAAVTVNADRVIDVADAAAKQKAALKEKRALSPEETFTSSELAIQMVDAPGLQPFIQETK
jgi:hypothetical protein